MASKPSSRKRASGSSASPAPRATVVHNKYVSIDTLQSEDMQEYLKYLGSMRSIVWVNFVAGTARGLGFVLGTVVVIALLTFIVSQVLSEIPWMGELFRWLDDWLKQNLESYSG